MGKKELTNFRLSAEARQLLDTLSDKLAISTTAVVEIAIHEKAKREKDRMKSLLLGGVVLSCIGSDREAYNTFIVTVEAL